MQETISRRATAQAVSGKNRAFSRYRHSFTMVPDSIDEYGLSNGAKNTLRGLIRLIRQLGGVCDWPERRIAAHLKLCRGTYRDHRRELEAAGCITLERRRQFGCRKNYTNLLRLGDMGLKSPTQKLKREVLKTTTTAPKARGVIKSRLCRLWEARFAQDRKDSAWRRAEFEQRAKVWEEAKRQRYERSGGNRFNADCHVSPDTEADKVWIVDYKIRNNIKDF